MRISLSSSIPQTAAGCAFLLYKDTLKKDIMKLPVRAAARLAIQKALPFFSGDEGESLFIPLATGSLKAMYLVGLGIKKNATTYGVERALHGAVRGLSSKNITRIACVMPTEYFGTEKLSHACAHLILANYHFSEYKKKTRQAAISTCAVIPSSPVALTSEMRNEITRGTIIGQEINNARNLGNMPGGDMTPTTLANHAIRDGKQSGFSVSVLHEKKMAELGMGGILGVSKGSAEEAKFIICDYAPKHQVTKKPIVFVGKGVTFDTGGLNIKPDMSMYEMHMDMSGGAAVIHAMSAIAKLRLPIRVIGLIPAVENMPGSAGYRPGDILRSYSKKTIEVKNTDAEGRIILADALGYAKQFSPEVIIDVATLTGAALVALGQRTAAVLSPDTHLRDTLTQLGEITGDRVWPLPLWPEHKREVKGDFGDVQNIGKTRYGGAISGAAFLWEFAPIQKWAHIDIAPTMTTIDDQLLAPGSRGAGVYLLIAFAETYAKTKGTT